MCRDKFVFGLHDTTMRTVIELLKTHLRSNGTPKVMSDVIAETKTMESCKKYQQINNRYLQRNWGTCTLDRRKNQVQKETVKWNSNMNQTHITGVVTSEGHIPTAQQMVTHAQSAEENDHFVRVCLESSTGPNNQGQRPQSFWNTPQCQGTSTNNRSIHAIHTNNQYKGAPREFIHAFDNNQPMYYTDEAPPQQSTTICNRTKRQYRSICH